MIYGASYDYVVTKVVRGEEVDKPYSMFKRVSLDGVSEMAKSRDVQAKIKSVLQDTHAREHVVDLDKVDVKVRSVRRYIPRKPIEQEIDFWQQGKVGRPKKTETADSK